jgi:hypothetical protein
MNCLISNGRVRSFNNLCAATGLRFSQASYLNLVTAGNFALKKYADKPGSNGTTVSLMEFLGLVKKGSKKFRRVMEKLEKNTDLEELRVVNTFFQLINANCAAHVCTFSSSTANL